MLREPLPSWLEDVRSVYQPVVEPDSLRIVGHEALARGPAGSPYKSPAAMFAEADALDLVSILDWTCRTAAGAGALAGAQHLGPLGLFVNVEPRAVSAPSPDTALSLLQQVQDTVPIVLEITERALTGDPAGLLAAADRARHRASLGLLAAAGSFVAAYAVGLAAEPAPGVRGVDLPADLSLSAEWDVLVIGPHFAGALLTRDVGDGGPDNERRFDYLVTYDREIVLAGAAHLLALVPAPTTPKLGVRPPAPSLPPGTGADTQGLQGFGDVATASRGADHLDCGSGFMAPADTEGSTHLQETDSAQQDGDPATALSRAARVVAAERLPAAMLNAILRDAGTRSPYGIGIADARHPEFPLVWVNTAFTSLTARVQAHQRADYLAFHDPLTGLANRAQLQAHLVTETARSDRSGTTVALLHLDLDDFKSVNDTLGHAAGDELLRLITARLQGVTRKGDLLARLGGDEFLVVVAGLDGHAATTAQARAASLVEALAAPIELAGSPLRTVQSGVSVGISLYPTDASSAEILLDHADQAMYTSKANGRTRVSVWQEAGSLWAPQRNGGAVPVVPA